MLGDNAPQDWGIADKTEWVAEKPFEGEAKMPALEGRDVVGYNEVVEFAAGQLKQMPAHDGKPARMQPKCSPGWNDADGDGKCQQGKPTSQISRRSKLGGNLARVRREKSQQTKPSTSNQKPEPQPKLRPEPKSKPKPEPKPKPKPELQPKSEQLSDSQKENIKRAQKELKQNTSVESYKASESFNKSTIFTNEEFLKTPPHALVKGAEFIDIGKELRESGMFPNGMNFPPVYLDLLSQLRVTKKKASLPISSFIKGAGAGQAMSQCGELMTMISSTMSDDQADKFFEILSRNPPSKSAVDQSWVIAAQANREAIKKAIVNNLGGGQIIAASWDVRSEVEELGLNYEDKGFSTDAFFRVKKNDGTEAILEVSLKKNKNVFFINGGAQSLAEQSILAMPSNSPVYKTLEEINAKEEELRSIKGAKKQLKELLDKKSKFLKEHTSQYNSDVYMDDLVENVYQPAAREILQNPDTLANVKNILKNILEKNPDAESLISALNVNSLEEALQIIANTDSDNSGEAHKKLLAKVFEATGKSNISDKILNKYSQDLDSKYRKYQRGLAEELGKDSSLRTAVIGNIRKEFPLKAVMNGEEVMAIGDASFDLKTAERIFGTTDIKKINQGLSIKVDEMGSPMLVYSAGQEGREISIATIQVRQKGKGYASMGFEAALHPKFYDELVDANVQENNEGVKRVKYTKAEAKNGPFDPKRHLRQHQTHGENMNKKPTYEEYLEILKNKKSSQGTNYADSMVFYKGKVLGRCPSGTIRSGKTCVPGAPAKAKGPGYKTQDLGGLTPAQVKALSKAKSTEDIIEAHRKEEQND